MSKPSGHVGVVTVRTEPAPGTPQTCPPAASDGRLRLPTRTELTRAFARGWRSKLLADASIVMTGQAVSSACLVVTSLVLARTLGLAEFGIYGTLAAAITFTAEVSELGIGNTLVRQVNYYQGDEKRRQFMLALALCLYAAIALAVLALGFLLAPAIARTLLPNDSAANRVLVRMAFAAASVSCAGAFVGAAFRAHLDFTKLAIWSAVPTGGRAILITIAVLVRPGEIAPAIAGYLCSAVIATTIGLTVAVRAYVRVSARDYAGRTAAVREFLGFTKWVAGSALLGTLATRLDTLLLAGRSTPENVALFTAANQIALLAPMGINAMNTILLPRVSRLREPAEYRSYLLHAYVLAAGLAAVMLLIFVLSPVLFGSVFGRRFGPSAGVFRVLCIAYAVSVLAWPVILLLYPLNRPDLITKVNLLQVSLQIPANYFLIPTFGAVCPAITFLGITVVGTAILLVSVRALSGNAPGRPGAAGDACVSC